ncbi:MAG: threonine synthase [Actinomycetota bacterium]
MAVYYKSTRDTHKEKNSCFAIVNGIAEDGGLYVPTVFPALDRPWEELAGLSYRELAFHVMSKFLPDFSEKELRDALAKAYDNKFSSSRIAPLVKKKNFYFLELFHGPTLAFKDMALSVLPHLLKISAKKLGIDKKIVILTATSGDTGKAALEGFSEVMGTEILVFYPREGVSKIQERQMVTQEGENTHVLAIEGNFDDAQNKVKEVFGDRSFREELAEQGYMFSSANSINIGRLVPQVAYYVYAYGMLLKRGEIREGEEINFTVPTGNFGNILAAYYARKIGVPIGKLICASNINNVLYDFINTGIYDRNRDLVLTSSPSMDILVSSNLERLLYDISGHDSSMVRNLIDSLNSRGRYEISQKMKEGLSCFYGGYSTEEDTLKAIRSAYFDLDYLIDTHTAVGFDVYRKYLDETGDRRKNVIVATASPFKFPAAVIKAIGGKVEGKDEIALIDELSRLTGRGIPARIEGIGQKKVLHRQVIEKDRMRQAIKNILNIS